jgi:Zn-dependent membrane protease YugP
MPYYYIDPMYFIIMAPVLLISVIAQILVKYNFNKYSKYQVKSGVTASKVAKLILEKNGVSDVGIAVSQGFLSDHYSPTKKTIGLSPKVINSSSISALGVAAHEAGHAIQHNKGMLIMRFWQALVIPASFISNAAIWLILAGAFLSLTLAQAGVFLFAGVVLFQIITLPLEFNASKQAKKQLFAEGFITEKEKHGINAVLNSAAMTYVAAAIASVAQLLYFAIRLGLLSRRD